MAKRLIFLIIYACVMICAAPIMTQAEPPAAAQNNFSNEKLSYNVYFHMGFIWAKAGYGELTFGQQIKNGHQLYHGQLAAKTLNVVEHIMKVRDTLDCWFNSEMVPLEFRKGTHEGSYNAVAHYTYSPYWHKKDAVNNIQNVDSTQVKITRWRKKGKDPAVNVVKNYSNKGAAYDMLTVFYSIRNLDYEQMTKGKKMTYVCYDGTDRLEIKVEFRGRETCELREGKKYDSYLVHLTFKTKGQDNTPLKVWLSKTPDHRPIKAVIGLKRIGSVQCEVIE